MDFDCQGSPMHLDMCEFMRERETLPMRVMQSVDTGNWNSIGDERQAGKVAFKGRVLDFYPKCPGDLFHGHWRGGNLEMGHQPVRSGFRLTDSRTSHVEAAFRG